MNRKKHCVIISGYYDGTAEGAAEIAERENLFAGTGGEGNSSYVICADGGFLLAEKIGLKPDLLVGDFDSLPACKLEEIRSSGEAQEIIQVPVEKDFTDLGLALNLAKEAGCEDVKIIGGVGGRPDMTIANIQDMAGFAEYFSSVTMEDDICVMTVAKGPAQVLLSSKNGKEFSVFSLSEEAAGVSEEGVYYTLDNHRLRWNFPLGVSNRIEGEKGKISVREGTILIVQLK